MNVLPEMQNLCFRMLGTSTLQKISILRYLTISYDSEVSKSCFLENWRNFERIISENSKFSKDRNETLLRGVNPPEILEETQTGMMGPHMFFEGIDRFLLRFELKTMNIG